MPAYSDHIVKGTSAKQNEPCILYQLLFNSSYSDYIDSLIVSLLYAYSVYSSYRVLLLYSVYSVYGVKFSYSVYRVMYTRMYSLLSSSLYSIKN